jgi:hypothetical protein
MINHSTFKVWNSLIETHTKSRTMSLMQNKKTISLIQSLFSQCVIRFKAMMLCQREDWWKILRNRESESATMECDVCSLTLEHKQQRHSQVADYPHSYLVGWRYCWSKHEQYCVQTPLLTSCYCAQWAQSLLVSDTHGASGGWNDSDTTNVSITMLSGKSGCLDWFGHHTTDSMSCLMAVEFGLISISAQEINHYSKHCFLY